MIGGYPVTNLNCNFSKNLLGKGVILGGITDIRTSLNNN